MKKFTLLFWVLVACVSILHAQTAITAPGDVKPGKIYWFESGWLVEYGYSTLYYPSASESDVYKGKIWSSYVWQIANDVTDPNQQFTFVEYEGQLYMYSIGAQKFLSWNNDGAHLVDIPTSYVSVSAATSGISANYPWTIAFDGTKLIACYPQNGYEYSGYLYCSGANSANEIYSWQIYEVGDYGDTETLTETLAQNMVVGKQQKEEALVNLQETAYDANEFLFDVAGYSSEGGGQITLQAADEDAGNYIWCNEPELNEGDIANLVDGDPTSFFHSRWNGTAEPQHWLQIDLEEPIKDFSFAYHTRVFDGGNDFPDVIEVLGSNDGKNFAPVAKFDSKLPQMANTRWESGTIEAAEEYSHLRFVVTAERVYFHMGEFYLYEAVKITANEAYLPYKEQLQELEALYYQAMDMLQDENARTADIVELTERIAALHTLIINLVTDADDPLTIEYVNEVKELLSYVGVGYPAETPRATVKALVDAAEAKPTAQARLDLEKAVEEYISTDDITLPVDGVRYSLTFVIYGGGEMFLKYQDNLLSIEADTLTDKGLSYPETAAFTCEDNNDGTYSFRTADGRYLTIPGGGTSGSGTESGVSDYKTNFTIVKMYPNGKCESNVTYEMLFGLVALSNSGTYMAPNSNGTTFYTGTLPHFMGSWTSAMVIEEFDGEGGTGIEDVKSEQSNANCIYDLQGRKVENPVKGIYIVNGKKVLVK